MTMKNLLRRWLLINSLIFISFSCKKLIKDDYPQEAGCEQYAGLYKMYDTENQVYYNMTIECAPSSGNLSDNWDSLYYSNFANLFNVENTLSSDGSINGTIIQPLVDKNGHSWTFANVYYPDTSGRINVLVGDSIYLYFSIDNTAYWQEDSVPYQSITSVHSGVKVH